MDLFGFIEEFTKGSPKKKAIIPKKVAARKKVAAPKKSVASPKKSAAFGKKGPVAPPMVQAKVDKVVAYHANQNQPVPTPKRFMIYATFLPTFITSQNKRVVVPEYITTSMSPEEISAYMTTSPPEVMTTFIPSEEIQFVTTYAPTEMPAF